MLMTFCLLRVMPHTPLGSKHMMTLTMVLEGLDTNLVS